MRVKYDDSGYRRQKGHNNMKIDIICEIAVTAMLIGLLAGNAYAEDATDTNPGIDAYELACELTANGWVVYGTDQCGWCVRQKEEFGDAFANVTYVNCMENRSACIDAGIQGIPCWASPNGTLHPGYHNLTRLSGLMSDYRAAHPAPTPANTIGFESVSALFALLVVFLMRRR
jgi:hypothetical protein